MMKAAAQVLMLCFSLLAHHAHAATDTFTSSGTWIVPSGVTSVTVEAWGGGGAGGGATGDPAKGGGGAGGQYASTVVAVTPGDSYAVTVGAGGAGSTGDGTAGGDSIFGANLVVAKGGAGGSSATSGVAGVGSVAGAVGTVVFAGGSGADGSVSNSSCRSGGAGGGGAGSSGAGEDASGNNEGLGTAVGGGDGGSASNSSRSGNSGNTAGGGGAGACAESSTDRSGGDGAAGKVAISYLPPPGVVSIALASPDPTTSNKLVNWTVTFNQSVTGVDSGDFELVHSSVASGANITAVGGSGAVWTVTANTGTVTTGTLQLNLLDDDTILGATQPLGGAGAGNGNFSGQSYTLLAPFCTGAADEIFCDDFERSNPEAVGNGWTIIETNTSNCNGTTGNRRCAGIDSDVPPFDVSTNPRANPTSAMFTRWNPVKVASPVISLAGKSGAQLSFWMRRGHDNFSECPEAAGENYLVEYYASDNTWKILAQYPSSPSANLCDGKIFTPTIELPPDALHADFQLRFYQPSGSGSSGSGGAPGVRGYDYWHMDDVIVRETPTAEHLGSFCDNFEGGVTSWSISAEGSPGNARIGDASIGTSQFQGGKQALDLRWGYVVASTFKIDLTGVNSNISYWVKSGTSGNLDPDSGEDLVVEYFNSAGSWSNLTTYPGSASAGTVYNESIAIPDDGKHANFRLRFRHLNASGYDFDYWHVDDVCVGDSLPVADLSISKTRNGAIVPGTNASYSITVTNNGPGTLSGSLQVIDDLPAELRYIAASGTGWSCPANFQVVTCDWTGTLANGASAPTVTLTVAVAASATGSISNTAVVTGPVADNNPGNNTSTDTANFYIPSYKLTDKACTTGVAIGAGTNPCHEISWAGMTAGQSLSGIYITALNVSGVPTQLSGTNPTTVNFQFALSCVNPTTEAGVSATFSAAVTSPGNPTGGLPLCKSSGAVPTTWSGSTALDFPATVPSVGPYVFTYADVGKVELYVRNAVATSQIGQSGAFVVKPAGFVLSTIQCTTVDAANCGTGALPSGNNPGAAAASGPTFIRAGDPFSITVTATNSLGNATPNYGRETNAESVKLATALVSPQDCDGNPGNDPDCQNPGLLGDLGGFSGGIASGTAFAWNEVGIITLTPSVADDDYLGAGPVIGTTSGNVGRFYPHHFDTDVTVVANVPMACPIGQSCPATNFNGFVYSGQPYSLTITAKNLGGGTTTTNYSAATGFAAPVSLNAFGAPGSASAPSGAGALGVTSTAAFVDGAVTVPNESYLFSSVLTAPGDVHVRATEIAGDGVSSLRLTPGESIEGGVHVVSGRYRIANAHGSELLPLPITVTVQYYDGTSWLTSATDSATTFNSNVAPAGNLTTNNFTGNLSAVTIVGAGLGAVNGGVRTITLGIPGVAGSVDLSLDSPSYLPSNTARATFGIYKGANEFIYQRENY